MLKDDAFNGSWKMLRVGCSTGAGGKGQWGGGKGA